MSLGRARAIRLLLLPALLAWALAPAVSAGAPGAQERSLLTASGTLFSVQAGLAADLGISDRNVAPNDFVIEWTAKRQDGKKEIGLVPGTLSRNPKRDLSVAFDEQTGSLVLLWSEHFSLLSDIRLAILKNGVWRTIELVPNLGLPLAHNPQMLLTHDTVTENDEHGIETSRARSILHVIWLEESSRVQARYVPVFLEQDLGTQQLTLYDLAVLAGSGGETDLEGVPVGAYSFPSIEADGLDGAVLVSFADLTRDRQSHYVARIKYDGKEEKVGRRIPVMGVKGSAPLPASAPGTQGFLVGTVIGGGYRPTLHWSDGEAVKYIRFDGESWSSIKTIGLDEKMTYEKAKALVEEMGKRN